MVHKTEVIYDTDPLDALARDVGNLPGMFQKAYAKNTKRPIRAAERVLSKRPARKPTFPFVWSRDRDAQLRAMRWYFAALAGKIPGVRISTSGGRYKRKGGRKPFVRIELDIQSSTVTYFLPGGGFGLYTVGPRQIPSHEITGWKRVDKGVVKVNAQLLQIAIDTWEEVTDKVGG